MSIGVQPLLVKKDPFVGFSSQIPLLTESTRDGQTIMVTAENKLRWFNKQSFSKDKREDAFRIFSLGGSTTYGRPYNDLTSFSGWLREMLKEADPSKEWEVINAGGISYASYRIVRIMEELSQFEPDLFIIYTGHNEFLEERTYRDVKKLPAVVRTLGSLLGRTRTYSLVNRMVHGADKTGKPVPNSDKSSTLDEEVKTRLDGGVGPDAYRRDEVLASQVLEHFRFNLQQMIQIARSCNAEILFITPASNLANSSPFKSEHAADFTKLLEWQDLYDTAKNLLAANDFREAKATIEQAITLSSEHAQTHFLHGRILQQLGEHKSAKTAFSRAKNEDVCPLRALSATVQIVRDVALENKISMVDFEHFLEQRAEDNIPGDSFFLDHVHPTIEGHRLLALEIFNQLANDNYLSKPADWNVRLANIKESVENRIDKKSHGEALRNLSKVLSWAGKKEEANRLALQASELIGGDAETAYLAGNALLQAGKIDQAMTKYREALNINANHVQALNSLATAFFQSSDFSEAEKNYKRVIQLQPDFAPAHNNLGSLYQKQKQNGLALQHYREAVRLNPRYSKAYNNIGVMLRSRREFVDAEKNFRKAIDIDSQLVEAHFNLGTVLDATQQPNEAMDCYKNAIRLNDRYGPAYLRLGMQFESQGLWRQAISTLQRGLGCPSPPIDMGRRLAWLLATCPDDSLRNGKVALQIAQGCVNATKGADAISMSSLAAAYAETGDFGEAEKWQTRAVKIAASISKATHMERLRTIQQGSPLRTR